LSRIYSLNHYSNLLGLANVARRYCPSSLNVTSVMFDMPPHSIVALANVVHTPDK
jgi:hypothetical protein